MKPQFLMGLDLSGRSIRCLLLPVGRGRPVIACRRWKPEIVVDKESWCFELDLDRCWKITIEAVREAIARTHSESPEILGIGISSMRHTTVALDGRGEPVLAAANRDARAAHQAMELAARHGEELYTRSGRWPNPISSAARLCWMRENMPGCVDEISILLSLNDWMALRLCGATATDASQACETLLCDLERREWSWDIIDQLDLPRSMFPDIHPSGMRLGHLSASPAAALGVKSGIPVAVAGADTQCALLGAGALERGHCCVVCGATAPIQMVADFALKDPRARMWTCHHLIPNRWLLESNVGPMGEALEWFAASLWSGSRNPVACLMAEASESEPGAAGFFSSFGATLMDGRNLTLPIGSLSFSPLVSPDGMSGRSLLARALLEGMAYGVRANLEQILSVSGTMVHCELRLVGGMSRSPMWAQLLSDVLDLQVQVQPQPEASAHGAALCAGVAAGVFADLAEAATATSGICCQYIPGPERASSYRTWFEEWRDLRRSQSESDGSMMSRCLRGFTGDCRQVASQSQGAFHPRMLVTAELDDSSLDALRSMGDVKYDPYRQSMHMLTGEDLVEAAAGCHVLITEIDLVDLDVLRRLPELKVIVGCRGTAVNIDVAACSAFGIPVLFTPGRNASSVAELTIAFMLMLARRLPEATAFLHREGCEVGDLARLGSAHFRLRGCELAGRTAGLIGLGAVGRCLAGRLHSLGLRVMAHDPYVSSEQIALSNAELVDLDDLLLESDFVSLHASVGNHTGPILGAEQFRRMKAGAFFINTARGALVDEEALLQALHSGKLAGAAIDVFSVEPPGPDHPLLSIPGVIATPHIGGNTEEVAGHQGRLVVEDLGRLLRGARPERILNPETLKPFSWSRTMRRELSADTMAQLRQSPPPAVSDQQQRADVIRKSGASPCSPSTEGLKEKLDKGLSALRGFVSSWGGKGTVRRAAAASPTQEPLLSAMQRIIQGFIAHAFRDPALEAFAATHRVSVQYVLNDIDLRFYMAFEGGIVTGGMGVRPQTTDVQLKMKAGVFDSILTGRLSGIQAAMTGRLSFSGDTRVAMNLQRIGNDLNRLYTKAREENYGSAELPTLAHFPPASIRACHPSGGEDIRQELLQTAAKLAATGLVTAAGGNISARSRQSDEFWITLTQEHKNSLRIERFVKLGLDGVPMDAEGPTPSSERFMHAAIYRSRSDVNAIIHAHAPHSTTLGLTGLPFLPISVEAACIGDLPRLPFLMPGSKELASEVARTLGGGQSVLLLNHGLVVASENLRGALNLVEVIERTAHTILECSAVGRTPLTLPEDVVGILKVLREAKP